MSRTALVVLTALGVATIGAGAVIAPSPRLVWNASASAPLGLYWVSRTELARGQLVLAEAPEAARQLGERRGYLPAGVRLVKPVAALAGDHVCASDRAILINGRLLAERLSHDAEHRPLPAWDGCRMLESDEIFLLQEGVAGSFDGRYFGPVKRSDVLGVLIPVRTYEARGDGVRRGDAR